MKIKIATSQFAVSADIFSNKNYIATQMIEAKHNGAAVIHFPEGSLSGYAGIDFITFDHYPWNKLKLATLELMELAGKLKIWVILGSSHPLTGINKPHNCLYIIDDNGTIRDRYDKRFCAGNPSGDIEELAYFSPGNHFCVFSIGGIRCGTLICHEYRYPEMYREYVKQNVQLLFHSFHAANMDPVRQKEMEDQIGEKYFPFNPGKTLPEITMPSSMISYAANNYLWISCSNSSAMESCWGGFVVRPDGVIHGRLRKNSNEFLITEIDTDVMYYDSTSAWRERAMNGIYYSAELVSDPRSDNRSAL
jgi:predicted amidohydrolase